MFKRIHFIWVILPILPFLFGFSVLELLNNGETDLLTNSLEQHVVIDETKANEDTDEQIELTEEDEEEPVFFHQDNLELRFFNSVIVYSAVGLFHLFACIAVIALMVSKFFEMPPKVREKSLIVLAISIVVLIAVNILARHQGFIGGLNLSYRTTCSALVQSNISPHILPKGCSQSGLSTLAWFAILPYLFGLLAAAFASSVVSTAHTEQDLIQRASLIDRTFQATSFILVTSTICLMLFYRLPLNLISDEGAYELVNTFSQGMGVFWGILFTLTLLAIFGPCNLMLGQAMAKNSGSQDDLAYEIEKLSIKSQISKILTILAPLLIGSSVSVIDLITGAL